MRHVGTAGAPAALLCGFVLFGCGSTESDSRPADSVAPSSTTDGSGTASSVGAGGGGLAGSGPAVGGNGGGVSAGGAGGASMVMPPHQADCGLANQAFCEDFETVHAGGRGGDLDEKIWSFSRWGHASTNFFNRAKAFSSPPGLSFENAPPTLCGQTFTAILPPDDAKICPGANGASNQFNELFTDNTGLSVNSMRIRQPFDFKDRTGKIVFDVDAKINPRFDGHGWWPEIWITDDPGPLPYHGAPTLAPYPTNGIGFRFDGAGLARGTNRIEHVFVSRNHEIILESFVNGNVAFNTQDGVLNHFELTLSTDKFELFATDAGVPGSLRSVGKMDGLDLNFTRGYIHFQHAHYNANKHCCGNPCTEVCTGNEPISQIQGSYASPAQVYRWDNIGFDGPVIKTPRSYDVSDQLKAFTLGGTDYESVGYYFNGKPLSFQLTDVDPSGGTKATFNFDIDDMTPGRQVRFRFNGHDWHMITTPTVFKDNLMRSYSAEVPLGDLVSGTNNVDVELVDKTTGNEAIGNIDLSVEL
jgi:hypothetical protein